MAATDMETVENIRNGYAEVTASRLCDKMLGADDLRLVVFYADALLSYFRRIHAALNDAASMLDIGEAAALYVRSLAVFDVAARKLSEADCDAMDERKEHKIGEVFNWLNINGLLKTEFVLSWFGWDDEELPAPAVVFA